MTQRVDWETVDRSQRSYRAALDKMLADHPDAYLDARLPSRLMPTHFRSSGPPRRYPFSVFTRTRQGEVISLAHEIVVNAP